MTDDIKALVAELREVKPTWDAARRAADTIEALEADRDEWMERADDGYAFTSDVEELIKHVEKAEQERDAYAAVIETVRAMLPGPRTFAESLARDHAGNVWPRMIDADEVGRILRAAPAETLAARDRLVAAEALRSASSLTTDDDYVFRSTDDVRDWLRVRADQIENGEEAHRG